MNRKLRLVVTDKCPNKCPMCCNNRFDLKSIPVFDRLSYDEISITGGEPMLFREEVEYIVASIRNTAKLQGFLPKIWLYTSRLSPSTFDYVCKAFDGICYTPHTSADIANFKEINRIMLKNKDFHRYDNLSLRLNLFKEQEEALKDEDLSMWKTKHMEWIKDCPIPEGEDFRRIAKLL